MNRRDVGSFHSSKVQELICRPEKVITGCPMCHHYTKVKFAFPKCTRCSTCDHTYRCQICDQWSDELFLELLKLQELEKEEYKPPSFPFALPDFAEYRESKPKWGHNVRNKHFYLETESSPFCFLPDVCSFINHGAFGCALKQALQVSQKWQLYTEGQPLRVLSRELLPHMAYITRRLAQFVGCAAQDLALVPNATSGSSAILRSVAFKPGDIIYCLDSAYGAVKKLIHHMCDTTGAVLQQETLTLPIQSEDSIVDLVARTLKPGTRLAVFDHITSNVGSIMPIGRLIELCKQREILCLIDGAHALGSVPLDISKLDPDFYVTNAHKWLCSPKGCGLLYVKRELQPTIHPAIVSHGFGCGFTSEFAWIGLRDYSPYIGLHTVLDFWTTIGPTVIREQIHKLLRKAACMLVDKWQTRLAAPLEMFGSMALVELPQPKSQQETNESEHCANATYRQAEHFQNLLFYNYQIEVPIKSVQGLLYVRISAHIYNEFAEYEKLASAALEIVNSPDYMDSRKYSSDGS